MAARSSSSIWHRLGRLFGRSSSNELMAQARRVILGLGNPGPEYADTRHNAGFLVSDAIAERIKKSFDPAGGPFVIADGSWRGTPFVVAKTAALYMNQSGTAVRKIMARYNLTPQDILIVYDDIALEAGQIRLRASGGAGGHNGVQDIIDKLGSSDFPRLRIGIGSDFPRGQQVDYVLGRFTEEQLEAIEEGLPHAVDAALSFVKDGVQIAMNHFNRR